MLSLENMLHHHIGGIIYSYIITCNTLISALFLSYRILDCAHAKSREIPNSKTSIGFYSILAKFMDIQGFENEATFLKDFQGVSSMWESW